MEGLCRRQSDQDDDLGGGRIHPSFSPSRAALRLCSHPSFWLSGQLQTKTDALKVLAGRPASSQPIEYRWPGQPRFSFPGTPMPDLQNRTADPHSGPDCRGMRLLSHAHDHRHLMSTISMPSIKSLPSSLALLRARGDPCREPSFWPSRKNIGAVGRPRNSHPPKRRPTVSTADSSRRQSRARTPLIQTVIQYP